MQMFKKIKLELGLQQKLLKKEQEVLLKAIEAYSGLVLANKKLKLIKVILVC